MNKKESDETRRNELYNDLKGRILATHDIYERIDIILKKLKFGAYGRKGYLFLKEAIFLVYTDPDKYKERNIELLYKEISKKFNAKVVGRIPYSISQAYMMRIKDDLTEEHRLIKEVIFGAGYQNITQSKLFYKIADFIKKCVE